MVLVGIMSWLIAAPVTASDHGAPYPGTRVIASDKSYNVLVKDLRQAIKDNGMGLVAQASASGGAASRGISIPGNAVLMVFRNDYAVRMLAISVPAGIEAPLRFYVTENADGKSSITYRLPSAIFGAYNQPALDEMAQELDVIFDKITSDTIAR